MNCPPDCPGNPFGFANYDKFRQVEERWFDKACQRVKGKAPPVPDIPVIDDRTEGLQELLEVNSVMSALLGPGPIATGSPLDEWAADTRALLSNDERVLTRFRARTRATVIEIQRRERGDRCIAIDIFDPAGSEFVIFHPTLSKTPRFSRFLGWFTWFPQFVHPLGAMIQLVPHLWLPWRQEVLRELRDRQNADYSMTSQTFLRENFLGCLRLIPTLMREWEESIEPMAPRSHYSAVYLVRDSIPAIVQRFKSQPACAPFMVLPKHPTYGICRGEYRFRVRGSREELEVYESYIGADKDKANERTIGMFSLYDDVLLFHCHCRPAFDRGRKLLDSEFNPQLEFDYEDILDVTGHLKQQDPVFVLEPLPLATAVQPKPGTASRPAAISVRAPLDTGAATEEAQQLIQKHHDRSLAGFLDRPHFLLEDRTPRDAAGSDEGRKQLIELMKIALYEIDVRNQQFQSKLHIDGILQELGFQDLIAADGE